MKVLPVPLDLKIGNSGLMARVTSEIGFWLKAGRPGFWLTATWFYLLPFQARGVQPLGWAFWLGLVYVGFPLGMAIYAANDLTDARTDALNPRKDFWLFGARPTTAQIRRLPWIITGVQLPFLALFCGLWGVKAIFWFAAVLGATTIYNFAPTRTKDRAGLDTLSQVGYLLVFVLSDWVAGASPSIVVYTFGALFAMHSHLFGQIMGIAPDALAGRRTTAVCLGAQKAKLLVVVLLLLEAVLARGLGCKAYLPPLLLLGALGFALDALVLWRGRAYPAWAAPVFLISWNGALLLDIALSVWL